MSETGTTAEKDDDRIFLVVVDDTEEMRVALRYACRRAAHTHGRVALLYVVESSEFQHWMSVGDLMREEARSEGEQILQRCATQVSEQTGSLPVLYLRGISTGDFRPALGSLLGEEASGLSATAITRLTAARQWSTRFFASAIWRTPTSCTSGSMVSTFPCRVKHED